MKRAIVLIGLILAGTALAQENASFKLGEHVFNSGGHPAGGTVPTSASFKISLDAIGDSLSPGPLSSASFDMDGGFGSTYPPPGEVSGLRFTDKVTLEWGPEKSAGIYNLYRDLQSNLQGFGDCEQQDLTATTTTDNDAVPTGDGYVYLVTVENLLDEEGTKGFQSDGLEREGAVCP